MPFLLEQSKVVFILETVTEGVALAQIPLVGKAKLEQQAFGSFIRNIDDRFNTMQPKFSKPVGQDGRYRFKHDALPPKGTMKFIAGRDTTKVRAELMETARADHSFFAFERDAPAYGFVPVVACLDLLNQCVRVVES